MSKIKYTKDIIDKAIEMRLQGKTIPEITSIIGMKKPSLQKLFQKNNIRLDEKQKEKALAKRWEGHRPIVDGQKQCSQCGDWRPIEEFHSSKNTLTGLVSACKDCYSLYYEENAEIIKTRVSNYRLANPEKKREANKIYYENHTDEYVQKAIEWDKKNPEKRKVIQANYDKRTQKQKNARTAKYRATKIQATPKWLSQQQLDEITRIYANCPPGYDVDHIVPLRGKGVRGLHTPWNLQYLPHLDNMKKSNKM